MDINEVLCNNKQNYFSEVIENFNFDECMNYLKEKDIEKKKLII